MFKNNPMNLEIKNRLFIVCGATSGFGLAVTHTLLIEQARVIAIARNTEKLNNLNSELGGVIEILPVDITKIDSIDLLENLIGNRQPDGILINASGPPAKPFIETTLEDWDQAYNQLFRWKVELTRRLLPLFQRKGYGRFLFIESSAIKQPIENLILSTSIRLSVAGFVKTLSQEIAGQGITCNIMAPGYHDTPAIDRIILKKSIQEGITKQEARELIINGIPMKMTGDANNFSSLAVWLLSPKSEFVTGQVFIIDGGMVKSVL
jgi:3-oxoacyl-[acyl-carrier protein] reductase